MAANTGIDVTPNMARFRNSWGGLWRGGAAGLGIGLAASLVGIELGSLAGGFLSSAVIGGQDGRTIAIVSGLEAVQSLIMGDS